MNPRFSVLLFCLASLAVGGLVGANFYKPKLSIDAIRSQKMGSCRVSAYKLKLKPDERSTWREGDFEKFVYNCMHSEGFVMGLLEPNCAADSKGNGVLDSESCYVPTE